MSLYENFLKSQLSAQQLQEVEATIDLVGMLQDDEKLEGVSYGWFKCQEDPPVRVKVYSDTKEVIVFARGSFYTIQDGETVANNRTLKQVKEFLYEAFG